MLQGTLFAPASAWRPPRVSELPAWPRQGRVAFDTETCDPQLKKLGPGVRRGAYICGFSFAIEGEGRGWYVPLKHLGGDNVEDPERALGWLREQAAAFEGELVGAKISYDLDFAAEASVTFPQVRAFKDVQVAEPLLDELQRSYSLDSILERHGLPLKDEALLREAAAAYKVDPKSDLHKLPARYVGPYAEADALRPLELLKRQEALIEERGLGRVWALECAVLPVLVRMRRRGVRVDLDHLDRVERTARAEEAKAWAEVYRLTGVSVAVGDAMKPEPLARALESIGVSVPKTPKAGKPSVDKFLLAGVDHPVGALIRRARQMSQLRTTFVDSYREHQVRGRIHTTFNQIVFQKEEEDGTEGAAYGRLSSVDPNLQQVPARDPEITPLIRRAFLADEGALWGVLDYSQQEPRIAVHLAVASGAERLGRAMNSLERGRRAYAVALEAQRRYREDPSTDFHTMFTSMVYGEHILDLARRALAGDAAAAKELKKFRDPMKNVFLGICYGMGGPKLCRTLGLPTKVIEHERTGKRMEVAGDEGQALMNLVDERVPYVRATARAVEAVAQARGYIVTLGGRQLHFPRDQYGNYDWTHKAFNRAIQGTAADQTKTAMVALDREGFDLRLQVHDEVDPMLADRAEGERAAVLMRECFPLQVPSKVDVEIGPSWAEAA